MLPLQRTLPFLASTAGFFTAASDSAKDAEALASAGEELMSSQKSFSMKALRFPCLRSFGGCPHAVRTSIGSVTTAVVPAFLALRSLACSLARCFDSASVNFFLALRSTPLLHYLPPAPGVLLLLSGCNRTNELSR